MEHVVLIIGISAISAFLLWHFFKRELEPQFVIIFAVVSIVISLGLMLGTMGWKTADTEILNGQVLSKVKESVSCSHSYDCHCRDECSGSGKDERCDRKCDTCYEHFNDWDWDVKTTIGNFTINRIDRRGSDEPPRWTKIQTSDPVAKSHSFTNYIRGVDASIFHFTPVQDDPLHRFVPSYPDNIYDYYLIDRVIPIGVNVSDIARWNYELALMLRTLGPSKQANAIILLTNIADPKFEYTIKNAWLGGKKNDVIIVIGMPEYPKIGWVGVISWSDKELFKVELRDELLALGELDRAKVLNIISNQIGKNFVRKQMADFKYLKAEIQPPFAALLIGYLLNFLLPLGVVGYIMYQRRKNVNRFAPTKRRY